MVSSSKSIPLVTANPDTLSVGDTDALVNKYLNEEAISLNHPEKAASLSSPGGNTTERHRKAQEDEKEPPRKRTETNNESRPRSGEKMTGNGGQAGAQGKDEHTNTNSSGAKPRGTRSVSKLSAAQLARKRANDREAQRAIRQRTKEHIENLERQIRELTDPQREVKIVWEMQQRNQELEREVAMLKSRMASMQMAAQPTLPSSTGAPNMSLGLTADGANDVAGLEAMGTMDWPQPLNMTFTGPDNLAGFEQPLGSTKPNPTTPGVDMPPSMIGPESGLMTPYTRSPVGGAFPDMTSGVNFDPLPGAADDLGLGGNLAPPSLPNTAKYQMSNQLNDPNMFSPPYMYMDANGMPPYNPYTQQQQQPPTLPSNMQPQIPSQMSNQQQMANQSQMSNQRRRSQQPTAPAPQSGQSGNGMVKYNLSPVPSQMQMPPPQQPPLQPQQQQGPQAPMQPMQQQMQQQLPPQSQQIQQPPQPMQQQMSQPRHPPPLKPKGSPPRQHQIPHAHTSNRPIQPAPPPPPPQQTLPSQPPLQPAPPMTLTESLNPPLWSRPPLFSPPTSLIDSLLHSALYQHRQYVLSGGPNPSTPSYVAALSAHNPFIPPSSRTRYSPLSDTITRAIQVAGFKDIATQAGTLYLSYVFLRWAVNPAPETWGVVPAWLRPGPEGLKTRHPVWSSMLQWGGLRERVIASGQGSVGRGQGRYLNDEFVLCYARNLVLEWGGKGRNLTGNAAGNAAGGGGLVQSNGTVMNGPGFDEGVFELGADGEVRLSEEFAKAVVGQDNWALRSEFFERYPELLDLARRATE